MFRQFPTLIKFVVKLFVKGLEKRVPAGLFYASQTMISDPDNDPAMVVRTFKVLESRLVKVAQSYQ